MIREAARGPNQQKGPNLAARQMHFTPKGPGPSPAVKGHAVVVRSREETPKRKKKWVPRMKDANR